MLLEMAYRYVHQVLNETLVFSEHRHATDISLEDLKLALQHRIQHTFISPPSKDFLLELAKEKNTPPLPLIHENYGLRLPPVQYTLTNIHYTLTPSSKIHHPFPSQTSPTTTVLPSSASSCSPPSPSLATQERVMDKNLKETNPQDVSLDPMITKEKHALKTEEMTQLHSGMETEIDMVEVVHQEEKEVEEDLQTETNLTLEEKEVLQLDEKGVDSLIKLNVEEMGVEMSINEEEEKKIVGTHLFQPQQEEEKEGVVVIEEEAIHDEEDLVNILLKPEVSEVEVEIKHEEDLVEMSIEPHQPPLEEKKLLESTIPQEEESPTETNLENENHPLEDDRILRTIHPEVKDEEMIEEHHLFLTEETIQEVEDQTEKTNNEEVEEEKEMEMEMEIDLKKEEEEEENNHQVTESTYIHSFH
ncbi:Transcription initiation factor TFIID subunit 9B [Coelomomyces lativittatus]|nr:Transcription initiation factor TFIID subunit 9B [Coelomomyces lativittatus]